MTKIFISKREAIENNGYDCSFRKDEIEERLRHLRSRIHYFEKMAKMNNHQGNGAQQMYCVKERAKLVLQKDKFSRALNMY